MLESVKNVHENTDVSGIWPFFSVKKTVKMRSRFVTTLDGRAHCLIKCSWSLCLVHAAALFLAEKSASFPVVFAGCATTQTHTTHLDICDTVAHSWNVGPQEIEECSRVNVPVFKKRGYPASIVQAGHHRAQLIDRQSSLQASQKQHSDRIPFTLTFHPHNHSVKSIILKNFKLLQMVLSFRNLHPFHSNVTKTSSRRRKEWQGRIETSR